MIKLRRGVVFVLRLPIYLYRYGISPMIGPRCRFQPTCSEYALEALERHGPVKGVWLALRRILRCHPWGGAGGFDPVPDRFAPGALLRYKRAVKSEDKAPGDDE